MFIHVLVNPCTHFPFCLQNIQKWLVAFAQCCTSTRFHNVEITQIYDIGQFIELVNELGVIMHDLSFSTLTKP